MNKERIFSYTFHLYILPEDLEKVKGALKKEGLFTYCSAYDVGSVAVSITYHVVKEKVMDQFCPFKEEVEASGELKGFYYVKFSWSGPEDESHLINFKKKYNFGMHLLGYAGDWLGYPICLFFSSDSKAQCKKVAEELRIKK